MYQGVQKGVGQSATQQVMSRSREPRSFIIRVTILWLVGMLPALVVMVSRAAASQAIPDPTTVTLTWNPSVDPTVTGYRLYYGPASGQYTNSIAVGNATVCTVTGLVNGTTYYFTTTAYNSEGIESAFSNEVVYGVAFSRLQIVALPGQLPVLAIEGVAGRQYEIEATENLTQWSVIGTITPNAQGTANFADPAAGGFTQRFYRLRDPAL